jgi:hypothetical protein
VFGQRKRQNALDRIVGFRLAISSPECAAGARRDQRVQHDGSDRGVVAIRPRKSRWQQAVLPARTATGQRLEQTRPA